MGLYGLIIPTIIAMHLPCLHQVGIILSKLGMLNHKMKIAFIIQMNEMAVDYLKLLFLLCHDLFEQCYSAISPPLPDEQIDNKSLSTNRAKNIFSPDDAATTIHILHLTLVKLFDVPSNFIKPFLSQLVEFQRSSMMLVDNVINSFLSDENRYGL